MRLHRTHHRQTCDKDISSRRVWASSFGEREETFRWLRENAPVSWHPPLENSFGDASSYGEAGFWALTLAEDISFASRNQELFSSELGLPYLQPLDPSEPANAPTMIELDPPRHTQYRKVLSSAFTANAVSLLMAKIEQRAEQIVDRVVGAGTFDFVAEVSSKLPMLTIADLVGVPDEKAEAFAEAGNNIIAVSDPETLSALPPGVSPQEWMNQQIAYLIETGIELAEARRAHPRDDIMTRLVQTEVGGRTLDNDDLGGVMVMLSIAGNDTTKHATSHAMVNLARHPRQRDWLRADFDGRIMAAIEEFVRHANVIMQFARTATRDVTIRGTEITAGDKVGLFYCSGNRDASAFPDPDTFDVTRQPSVHLAFGGGGVHYCLGAGVARAQLRALFRQILRKLPNIEVGEPEPLTSNFVNGIKRLPVTVN
jgi:cytochrome P450